MIYNLKITYLVLLIIAFNSELNAQNKDYIINAKADTISGNIKGYSIDWVKFKNETDPKLIKLSSSDVKEFSRKNHKFLSVKEPGQVSFSFLELLEEGDIKLLEYFKRTGTNNYIQRWYVSKENGSLLEIKSNWGGSTSRQEKKENFASVISDNRNLLNEYLKKGEFDTQTLRYFINQYNKNSVK